MKRYNGILFIILIIATVLRFWQLGLVPSSPDWDEAALGYNAYSILKTGRDEYGTLLPVTLRSFDDYKPPLYAYLAIPAIRIFGLDTWVVRLPSAIMGIFAVLGTYVLVYELFKKREISLLAAFLLAISPWSIQFSRIAFEANTGVTLNIWALICFFKGLKSPKWLIMSVVLFGLGLYAYHSERIFLPILMICLSWIYRRELLLQKRFIGVALIAGFLTVSPLLRIFFDSNTLTRLRGTSSLADQTMLLARSVTKLQEDQKNGNPWGIIFDNRRLVWAKTLVNGYLSHYSFRWLFLTGDNPRHHAPDMGLLYLWELPFLLWGAYALSKQGGRAASFLFSWFLVAPIAASPTTELPHAIRSIVFLPTFQIFTALGVLQFFQWLQRKKNLFRFLVLSPILLLVLINTLYYLHLYFAHTNTEFSKYWQYGYKQAVEYAQAHKDQYKKIVVSTKLEQPHMFFLYYLRYDPATYLKEGGTSSGGFAEYRNKFDIYEFREIDWGNEKRDGSTLFIGTPQEISGDMLETIYYLDGTEAIRIAK